MKTIAKVALLGGACMRVKKHLLMKKACMM